MENKKQNLAVNCVLCDATNVKEETLAAYEQIHINAAVLAVSEESAPLLHRYGVDFDAAATVTAPVGTRFSIKNGSFTLTGDKMPSRPTVLVVNGYLRILPDAGDALAGYASIVVNGYLLCPESLAVQAADIQVNGSVEYYPDDAILLKRTLVVDKVFLLRAKAARYFVPGRVVLTDTGLDVASLAEKGVRFLTKKAIIAEPLLETAIPLFDDSTEIICVPADCAYVNDDLTLDKRALRKYGSKIYVNGDLKVNAEEKDTLAQMEYLYVDGTIKLPEELADVLATVQAEYDELKFVQPKKNRICDRTSVKVTRDALETGEALAVIDCALVTLAEDIPASLIMEKLTIRDCARVCCTPEQRGAVEMVCHDVVQIQDGSCDLDIPLAKEVNALSYRL